MYSQLKFLKNMFKDLPKDKVVNKSFKNILVFYNDTWFQSFDFNSIVWNWLEISEWKLSESKSNTLFSV